MFRHFARAMTVTLFLLVSAGLAYSQVNGKLQLHFMDVGQGDGAVLISPGGEVVLFDDGKYKFCDKPMSYLHHLGIDHIDYLIVSHYHADHIGCTKEVLGEFPLRKAAYDRGGSYPGGVFTDYAQAVGNLRQTATKGQVVTLDGGSPKPVKIQIAALNGNGVQTTNENDLSLVAVVRYGDFDAVIGGDLSGVAGLDYKDIESGVASTVGQVEVYKVHHHCSRYSTNATWLDITRPKVGIVSVGDKANTYGHPTAECLERLHQAGVAAFWTEHGQGADPQPGQDSVCGDAVVTVDPQDSFFRLECGNSEPQTIAFWGSTGPPAAITNQYAWSSKSTLYHYAQCAYVRQIKPEYLQRGDTPPVGKSLHSGCPKAHAQ